MRNDEEQRLYEYIRHYKPKVLVMAPQCTGMAGWGRRNLLAHPDSAVVQQSFRTSHHLGTICANCAFMQLSEGRHYFIEQPKGSDLYKLPIFQRLSYMTGANDFEKCAIWICVWLDCDRLVVYC